MRIAKFVFVISFLLVSKFMLAQEGNFTYQFHSNEAKGGSFTFTAPDTNLAFKTDASAGYLVASNNPYYQATKNAGPIPNGTWIIYEIKDESKFILRLKPSEDVVTTHRSGFLIHGTGQDKSAEESSLGCIILDRESRKKLVAAFKKYGEIKIKVTNIVTGDPTSRG